jgi:hypothetical protein
MAGTIIVSTISDGTNSTSSTNCIRGSAKAWVNFAGSATPTINSSYNISSITYNSTGLFTLNFTTAMPNASYAAFGSCSTSGTCGTVIYDGAYTNTTSTFQFATGAVANFSGSLTLGNYSKTYVAVFSN